MRWFDRDVFDQQRVVFGNEDQNGGQCAVLLGHPDLMTADDVGVVGQHRRGWAADERHVLPIGAVHQIGNRHGIAVLRPA